MSGAAGMAGTPLPQQQLCSAPGLRQGGGREGGGSFKIALLLSPKQNCPLGEPLADFTGKLPWETSHCKPRPLLTVHEVGLFIIMAFHNVTKNEEDCDFL